MALMSSLCCFANSRGTLSSPSALPSAAPSRSATSSASGSSTRAKTQRQYIAQLTSATSRGQWLVVPVASSVLYVYVVAIIESQPRLNSNVRYRTYCFIRTMRFVDCSVNIPPMRYSRSRPCSHYALLSIFRCLKRQHSTHNQRHLCSQET